VAKQRAAWISVILLHVAVCIPSVAAGERLKILTYNIHHGEGVDGELDLERIAGIIRRESPDLVALQEVDQGTRRTYRVDQPEELARLTRMQVVFGKNISHEGGNYGNAILSRLPIKWRHNLPLPSLPEVEPVDEQEQRGALIVEVLTQSDTLLYFVSTHLDHRRTHEERLAGAQTINEWFQRGRSDRIAILAGDLNATPDSPVLRRFATFWKKAGEDLATVPVKNPRKQIDYVLYRPAHRWRVVTVRVLGEPTASDHRPLIATLELLPLK
jgi:endonuclease/exonuclease/phosphatase family metal-dependent hydrolase